MQEEDGGDEGEGKDENDERIPAVTNNWVSHEPKINELRDYVHSETWRVIRIEFQHSV